MGSPCIFGFKKGEEFKVTYNHYGRNIIDSFGFGEGTLFKICRFIQSEKVNKERLISMFNILVLEQDEDNFAYVIDNNISFVPTIEQSYLSELFVESNLGFMNPDGTYHIVDYSMETYNQYYIDIDKESVVIHSDFVHFEIPISLIQQKDEKWLSETIKTISKAYSYCLGIDVECMEKFFLLKRYESGKMTQKGQVTIPIEVREALKVKEGDRLEFTLEHQKVVSVYTKTRQYIKDFVGLLGQKEVD